MLVFHFCFVLMRLLTLFHVTVSGLNFGVSGATVLIGASLCTDTTHNPSTPHRRIVCSIPQGTGADLPIIFLQNGGSIGISSATVSYEQRPPGTRLSALSCVVFSWRAFLSRLCVH
jgi:hypothetical protein